MLVLMKGAINWYYTVTKEKLLPVCGEPGESLQKESEEEHVWIKKERMFELHEEVLQEVYEESVHPQSMEDQARGLGQWTPSSPIVPASMPGVSLSLGGGPLPRVSLSPGGGSSQKGREEEHGLEDMAKGLGQWTPSTPPKPTAVPRVSLSPK